MPGAKFTCWRTAMLLDQGVRDSASPSLSRKFLKLRWEMITLGWSCVWHSPLCCIYRHEGVLIDESLHTGRHSERQLEQPQFQAWSSGSRVNAATRDRQQPLSPHLLNKWRDPSKKAQRTMTDDHSGGERYVYMDVCDHTSSGVCAHTLVSFLQKSEEILSIVKAGLLWLCLIPPPRFQLQNFQIDSPVWKVVWMVLSGLFSNQKQKKRCIHSGKWQFLLHRKRKKASH